MYIVILKLKRKYPQPKTSAIWQAVLRKLEDQKQYQPCCISSFVVLVQLFAWPRWEIGQGTEGIGPT